MTGAAQTERPRALDDAHRRALAQSHQLRGPVATILGLAQLFNLADHTDPANKEIIKATVEATQSLDVVIMQINAKTSEAGELLQ